jgi:hypothetical protein
LSDFFRQRLNSAVRFRWLVSGEHAAQCSSNSGPTRGAETRAGDLATATGALCLKPASTKLGTFSTLSIGIGGMVGGGIFAVTGLTIEVTKGGAPVACIIAGVVALLTSYSYLRLTLAYPSEGGTVKFLNRAFGGGILTGASCILLLLSYVVLLAVYVQVLCPRAERRMLVASEFGRILPRKGCA